MIQKNKLPKISIIILNYNGKKIISIPLNSIKKINYPKNKLEIIIVDNASKDGSQDFIKKKYPFVKIIQMKKNMAYSSMNEGIKKCRGEFCFILNNDLEIERNCLKELVKAFYLMPDAAGSAPSIHDIKTRKLLYTKKFISRSFYNGSLFTRNKKINIKEESYTGVPFLNVNIIKKLPYVFDPDYFIYVEDVDLAYRLRLLGFTMPRAKKAIIYHEGSATTKKIFKKPFLTFLNEKNMLQTYIKNLETKNLILWFPYYMIFRIIKIIIYICTFHFLNLLAMIKAWFWVIKNYRKIFNKRKEIQKTRIKKDKEIFKKMGNEKIVIKYMLQGIFGKGDQPIKK